MPGNPALVPDDFRRAFQGLGRRRIAATEGLSAREESIMTRQPLSLIGALSWSDLQARRRTVPDYLAEIVGAILALGLIAWFY